MNRSGIIKRGLAATAISALAVTGIPALAGTANAAVGSVSVSGFNAFDVDEFATPDDFTVTVRETGGTPTVGQAVEYKYVFTPQAGGPAVDSGWQPNAGVTDADGKLKLNFVPAGSGSYVLTVRSAGSQISSPAFNFVAGESEIFWADGASASSPVNGSDSYTGVLSLTNAAQTVLSGRRVDVTYAGGEDANFGTQTAPAVRDSATTAHSTTGADGTFTVSLTDVVATPPNPETGTLTATAAALKGAGDVPAADATDALAVSFEEAPVVKAVTLTKKNVFPTAAPGKPVELNVSVTSEGATPLPGDDVVLKDYPVSFTVDKGFLTPDSKPGLTTGINDLKLTAEQDDEGDLFGFYEDLGKTKAVDTSDDQGANNAAGIIATIGKDAGFNDDGLVTQTVTVAAGGKTATTTVSYDVRDYLNMVAVAFRKDGGSTNVPGNVDLKLYAADQFGNLVGDQAASVSDNTPVARATTEPGGATTDFINDNPSVRASSDQPVSQTITASINSDENLVNATGDKAAETSKVVKGDTTLRWGNGGGATRTRIIAKLKGFNNGGKADHLNVVAPKKANGATVKLFRLVGKRMRPVGTMVLTNGRAKFVIADRNGRNFTKYVAKVRQTNDTKGAKTNRRNVR